MGEVSLRRSQAELVLALAGEFEAERSRAELGEVIDAALEQIDAAAGPITVIVDLARAEVLSRQSFDRLLEVERAASIADVAFGVVPPQHGRDIVR